MALKDLLVGIDPSTEGEGRLKLALNLVRAHQAHITACYVMREEHDAPVSPILAGMRIKFRPRRSHPTRSEDHRRRAGLCAAAARSRARRAGRRVLQARIA